MKHFTVPATESNLEWCSINLADADWDLKENAVDILIYYIHDFQKWDILNALESLNGR